MKISGGRDLTRGLQDLRKRVFQNVTDRHTSGHCNSMTESAQWADSVKKEIWFLDNTCFSDYT